METTKKTTDELLVNLFEELKSRPDSIQPHKGLLVLSSPRSGSSLFCERLSNTDSVGQCLEWFNFRYMEAYQKVMKVDTINFADYFDFLKRKTTLNTGVFAINVHLDQYSALLQKGLDVFAIDFNTVIYLSRKDLVAQAVSLAKAIKSDKWSSKALAKADEHEPSVIEISKALTFLLESSETYKNNLKTRAHFEYIYEDFAYSKELTFYSKPLEHLNVGLKNSDILGTSLKPQSNSHTKESIKNFKSLILGH